MAIVALLTLLISPVSGIAKTKSLSLQVRITPLQSNQMGLYGLGDITTLDSLEQELQLIETPLHRYTLLTPSQQPKQAQAVEL
jgi:hypothetical protein